MKMLHFKQPYLVLGDAVIDLNDNKHAFSSSCYFSSKRRNSLFVDNDIIFAESHDKVDRNTM